MGSRKVSMLTASGRSEEPRRWTSWWGAARKRGYAGTAAGAGGVKPAALCQRAGPAHLCAGFKTAPGVPWQLSRLRTWCCPCCGSCHRCSMGSITGLGTSLCCGCSQKKKKNPKQRRLPGKSPIQQPLSRRPPTAPDIPPLGHCERSTGLGMWNLD